LLFRWTIYFVTNFLGQLGFPSSVNAILHEITVNDFTIIIAPSCLGYQGMMIALAALGFYFMIYRKNYIFPNVLLLFPIVVLTLFIANCLRIAVLLIVGAMGSPDIALNGFHVVAGWLNLLIIMGASILLVNRLPFFAKDATGFTLDLSQDKVRLAPEVLLILVSLVSLLATAKFEWAYPLRVIIVGAVLWRWWPRLGLVFSHKLFLSVIAGVIVFALWLALVPTDATRSAEFHQTLTSVPVWLMLVWMVFRLLGAVVVVPLAEELAFRGYLFDATGRLLKQTIPSFSFSYSNSLSEPNGFSDHSDGGYAGNANSSWLQTILVLAITSIGFGILHSAWLAGILAGVAFGLVRLYRNNLMDAVIAHGVTNLLLAVYVMSTGAWSLW
jgi:exosortase E/protease (VPEID-CTERM system)